MKRKEIIERSNEGLSMQRKCELLDVPRSSLYYKPKAIENDDVIVMNEIRCIYQKRSYYGYRKITVALRKKGLKVNHKRVQRLLQKAGIKAIYPSKKTSIKNHAHKIYPYLLRGMSIERPNQVWQVDITYIKIRGGWLYMVCLVDVFSRKIMGWNLSTFLDTQSCLEALESALKINIPEIINSDQGCQFTSDLWVDTLQQNNIFISMDGKGRWADNIYIERVWRSVKYEVVFLHSFETVQEAQDALEDYIIFYNEERSHQSLNYHTPNFVFMNKRIPTKQELFASFVSQQKIYTTGAIMQ